MKRNFFLKSLSIAGAMAAATMFASCNIFNPTGNAGSDDSASSYQEDAYKEYRKGHYDVALKYFKKAIAEDSTNSEAYLGAAKATLAEHHVNAFTILSEVKGFNDHIPFVGLKGEELDRNYEGVTKSLVYIRELARRDSITRFTNKKLSNRKLRYESVAAGHSILELAAPLLRFGERIKDIDIDFGIVKDVVSLFVADGALQNPLTTNNLNEVLSNLGDDLEEVADVILPFVESTLNLGPLADKEGSDEVLTQYVKDHIDAIKNQLPFYRYGDHIDNDGDGCVDEEINDGMDNDGDGLIDEDVRVFSPIKRMSADNSSPYYNVILKIYPDGIDHDMNGVVDDSGELEYYVDASNRVAANDYRLKYAAASSFKNSDNHDLKKLIAMDTNYDHVIYPLEVRKQLIGGCWVNYDEAMFKKWFEGRN